MGRFRMVLYGPVIITETKQRYKHARRLPYYRTMGEKKDKITILQVMKRKIFKEKQRN